MYFDRSYFLQLLWGYIRGLRTYLTTSYMALFTDGVAGIHDGDVSIQFPGMVRDWYQSSPLSLGGWIARWFIALPLLTAVGIIVGTIALIKVLSWLACMPLAATMYALVSMRFSTTATE